MSNSPRRKAIKRRRLRWGQLRRCRLDYATFRGERIDDGEIRISRGPIERMVTPGAWIYQTVSRTSVEVTIKGRPQEGALLSDLAFHYTTRKQGG
jgi:hypothetical protein